MKKQVFGINFDPKEAAGAESRLNNNSLDRFMGDGKIYFPREKIDGHGIDHKPVEKFKTFGLPQTLPSVILRKKGKSP